MQIYNSNACDYCREFFEDEGINFRPRYRNTILKLVNRFGDEIVIDAINRLTHKIVDNKEDIENAVTDFFQKLPGTSHNLSLSKFEQAKKKLIGFMNCKFDSVKKSTHETNVQNLISLFQSSYGDDEDTMETKLQEACKMVYPAKSYEELLISIERHFKF